MNSPDAVGCLPKALLFLWQNPYHNSGEAETTLRPKGNFWFASVHHGGPLLVSDWFNPDNVVQYKPMNYEKVFSDCPGKYFIFCFWVGKWLQVMAENAATIFLLWQVLSWHTENSKVLRYSFRLLSQATRKLPYLMTFC